MTAQIFDELKIQTRLYSIVGKNGKGLFDPSHHSMRPLQRSSACWRGYACVYSVEERKLLLDRLGIFLEGEAPILFNAKPKSVGWQGMAFNAIYENLDHPVSYTGGLLIGDDFIEEYYVHMGFHPAWKFREVHELVFQNGELIKHSDCSEKMAELRQELVKEPLEPGLNTTPNAVLDWIKDCFIQDYEL